jgi:hypothetical protein
LSKHWRELLPTPSRARFFRSRALNSTAEDSAKRRASAGGFGFSTNSQRSSQQQGFMFSSLKIFL